MIRPQALRGRIVKKGKCVKSQESINVFAMEDTLLHYKIDGMGGETMESIKIVKHYISQSMKDVDSYKVISHPL